MIISAKLFWILATGFRGEDFKSLLYCDMPRTLAAIFLTDQISFIYFIDGHLVTLAAMFLTDGIGLNYFFESHPVIILPNYFEFWQPVAEKKMFKLALPQLATPPSAMVVTDQVFSYFCRGLPNNSEPIYAYISIFFRAYSHFCQIICNSNYRFQRRIYFKFLI